jgi:hypothetical protein
MMASSMSEMAERVSETETIVNGKVTYLIASSPPGVAVRRTASLRSPMARWSMPRCGSAWIAGSSPAMTKGERHLHRACRLRAFTGSGRRPGFHFAGACSK